MSKQMVTRVVDPATGARELNPDYCPPKGAQLKTNLNADKTLIEAFLNNLQTIPDSPILGFHKNPEDPFNWITWKELFQAVQEFGSGLKNKLGIEPNSSTKVGIYGINCVDWVVAHFGLLFFSNIAVPLYSTLGNEAMSHIVSHTEMEICICQNEEKLQKLLQVLTKAGLIDKLKVVILMESVDDQTKIGQFRDSHPHLTLGNMDEVREAGRQQMHEFALPREDSIYVINFTSGTTGVPKGVMVTVKMVTLMINLSLGSKFIRANVDSNDVYFSFLPLAHILEQVFLAMSMFVGARSGFFSGNITKLAVELPILKPTILVLVPRLLTRFYEVAMTKLKQRGIPLRLFRFAIRQKLASIAKHGPGRVTFWDRTLFKRLKASLGGNVRLLITGSAACSSNVVSFSRACFGAQFIIGYGSTELGGAACMTYPEDVEPTNCGAPLPETQIRLADVPEMDLYPSRNSFTGKGEICIKAATCTQGYYMEPDLTKELFDSDGWLHTGDIGEWDKEGQLRIVDRCKNIFKLNQGEYIAPEKVESIYMACPYVEQVFLDGYPDQSYAIALVLPSFDKIREQFSHASQFTPEQICADLEIARFILDQLTQMGRQQELASFEQAKKVHLIAEPMTIENQMLTSTLKLVRAKVRAAYKSCIDQLYA